MKYDPKIHHRHSIRLKGYNYSRPGAYFITICTHNRNRIFGNIGNGKMVLNEFGEIAHNEWIKLYNRIHHLKMDVFQIMPDHIHGIIFAGASLAGAQKMVVANENYRAGASPAPTTSGYTIGNIVGIYKSLVANECLKIFKFKNEYMGKLWQRNYYEHIIRHENELHRIRRYIINNPIKWNDNKYHL